MQVMWIYKDEISALGQRPKLYFMTKPSATSKFKNGNFANHNLSVAPIFYFRHYTATETNLSEFLNETKSQLQINTKYFSLMIFISDKEYRTVYHTSFDSDLWGNKFLKKESRLVKNFPESDFEGGGSTSEETALSPLLLSFFDISISGFSCWTQQMGYLVTTAINTVRVYLVPF